MNINTTPQPLLREPDCLLQMLALAADLQPRTDLKEVVIDEDAPPYVPPVCQTPENTPGFGPMRHSDIVVRLLAIQQSHPELAERLGKARVNIILAGHFARGGDVPGDPIFTSPDDADQSSRLLTVRRLLAEAYIATSGGIEPLRHGTAEERHERLVILCSLHRLVTYPELLGQEAV